ncbi:MAG TPA: hypothetical protein VER03_03810 [Bryobacteraceae bacterium]|nr:hypothetical protein [Bryobacteraceae bacterium]
MQYDQKSKDEQTIKDIITRYGEVIDLRKTPYLILEIVRNYAGGLVNIPDGGVSVAGVGTPPGPTGSMAQLGNVVDNAQIMKEVLKLSRQVTVLTERIEKMSGSK